ncbi:MAG: DUF4491 family protein [Lachnospiraceae bacterium]|nr:DUF4491 family protein [Lachnospiraceae bacterium]
MYIHGIILGLVSFLTIGIFHPIVIWAEYHFTEKIWPVFAFAGVVCLFISCMIENVVGSAMIGVVGFSCFWSIIELKQQTKRVERGWFPKNPDRYYKTSQSLCHLADQRQVELVITSGGTGFSLRDQTPEATLAVADRNAPGITEYIRMRFSQITDRAVLSRGVSVIRKGTLIINLPGSVKAVRESLEFILNPLDHGLKVLRGSASECGGKEVRM